MYRERGEPWNKRDGKQPCPLFGGGEEEESEESVEGHVDGTKISPLRFHGCDEFLSSLLS